MKKSKIGKLDGKKIYLGLRRDELKARDSARRIKIFVSLILFMGLAKILIKKVWPILFTSN